MLSKRWSYTRILREKIKWESIEYKKAAKEGREIQTIEYKKLLEFLLYLENVMEEL